MKIEKRIPDPFKGKFRYIENLMETYKFYYEKIFHWKLWRHEEIFLRYSSIMFFLIVMLVFK